MPVTSDQSRDQFMLLAWNYLQNPGTTNASQIINGLYRTAYANFNPSNVQAKVALTGQTLWQNMATILNAAGQRTVLVQWTDQNGTTFTPIADLGAMEAEFTAKAQNPLTPLTLQADRAWRTFLHFLPAQARNVRANWRIVVNVKPADIANAVAAALPIVDGNNFVDEVKLLSPGVASKPDSVIFYLRKPAPQAYQMFVQAVTTAFQAYTLQPLSAPMTNELADGLAECSDPPKGGFSFGTYRCIATAIAYDFMVNNQSVQASLTNFKNQARHTFGRYGIPYDAPQDQISLETSGFYCEYNKLFFQWFSLYENRLPDYYANKLLFDN